MALAMPYVAFILPSGPEMIVILLVGIMLFGRRLPEVGRSVGQTVVKLRRGLNKLKNEMEIEGEIRDVKDAFRDTRRELTRDIDLPRLRDPGQMFQDLTDANLSSFVPPDVIDQVPDSIFDSAPEENVGPDSPAEVNGADSTERVSGSPKSSAS